MVSYAGLFAGMLLLFLPGALIYLLSVQKRKTSLSEVFAFGFGLSVIYLLIASYLLQLVYKIDPYALLLPLPVLAFFAIKKNVEIEKDRWFLPLLGMFLVNFSLKFVYMYQFSMPVGVDASFHTLVTRVISEKLNFPADFTPYSTISLNYTPGLHAISAVIFLLSQIKIWWSMPLVSAIISAAGVFFSFSLVSRLLNREIAVFSAFSYSFLALTPYSLFSSAGSYPDVTGMSFIIFGFLSFVMLQQNEKYSIPLFTLSAASILLLHGHTAYEFFSIIGLLSVLQFAKSKKLREFKPIVYLGVSALIIGFWLFPVLWRMFSASVRGYTGMGFPWPVPLFSYMTYLGLAGPFAFFALLNKKIGRNRILWSWFLVLFLFSFAYAIPVLKHLMIPAKAFANAAVPASLIAGVGLYSSLKRFKSANAKKAFLMLLVTFSVAGIYLLNVHKTTINTWMDQNDRDVLFKVEDLVPPNCAVLNEAPGGLWIPAVAKRQVSNSPYSNTDDFGKPEVYALINLTYTMAQNRGRPELYQKAVDAGIFFVYRKNLSDDPYLSELYKKGDVALYHIKGAPLSCP